MTRSFMVKILTTFAQASRIPDVDISLFFSVVSKSPENRSITRNRRAALFKLIDPLLIYLGIPRYLRECFTFHELTFILTVWKKQQVNITKYEYA